MTYEVRIPQIGARGVTGAQIIEKTNTAPDAEDGNEGDLAVRFDSDGKTWLYGKKTSSGWPATPRALHGSDGEAGAPGSVFVVVSDAPPDPGDGSIGDVAVRYDADDQVRIYGPKTLDGWGDGYSLIGPQGDRGWWPILVPAEVDVESTPKLVFKLIDWVGGEGVKPIDYVNEYVDADGTGFTSDPALALEVNEFIPNLFTVRADIPQSFTGPEKSRARVNIGADVLSGFRNKLINGNFDIWQRGTSFSLGYTADRWFFDMLSGGATITRQAFALGQTDVPGNPRHFIQVQRTSAGPQYLEQRVEGAATLAGRKVTLTFYARCTSGSGDIGVMLGQNFGGGGTPSTGVVAADETVTLTTAWTRFDLVVDLPSVSGKTLGTDGDDYLGVEFDFAADELETSTIQIARVSLVEGDATIEPDPFSPRHIQEEVVLCQRYFRKSFLLNTAPGTSTASGYISKADRVFSATATSGVSQEFDPPMRAAPTVTLYAGGVSGKVLVNGTAVDGGMDRVSQRGFRVFTTAHSGMTANDAVVFTYHYSASAEL